LTRRCAEKRGKWPRSEASSVQFSCDSLSRLRLERLELPARYRLNKFANAYKKFTAMRASDLRRVHLEVTWFPILPVALLGLDILVVVILYATGSPSHPGIFPTVSYTAIPWPGNRIFAIGMGIAGVLIMAIFVVVSSQFQLGNAVVIGKALLYVSLVCGVLFALTGLFNLGEVGMLHSGTALALFLSLIAVNLLTAIGEIRINQRKFTVWKLIGPVICFCLLIAMVVLKQIKESAIQFSFLGFCEYIVLIIVSTALCLCYHNFKQLQIIFCVEMPADPSAGSSSVALGRDP